MGGVIALQLAATHPELSAAVCLIDSVVFPSDAFIAQLKLLGDQLAGAAYIQTLQLAAGALFIETDDPVRKAHVLAEVAKTSQHVAVPAFRNHLLDYDASRAARACRVPIAYIAASNLMADLGQFKQLCPQLVTAQTIGSGHFSPLEVPEQVNAMLERFVKISLPQDRGHAASGFRDGGSLMPRQNCGSRTCVVTGPHARQRRTTSRGRHRGGFRPPHLKDSDFDEARTVDEQGARAVARRLAKDEGIFAGTSSAMNVVAALQLAAELGPGKTVATVAVDSGFKYLAGICIKSENESRVRSTKIIAWRCLLALIVATIVSANLNMRALSEAGQSGFSLRRQEGHKQSFEKNTRPIAVGRRGPKFTARTQYKS
jgi:hypothetical protein